MEQLWSQVFSKIYVAISKINQLKKHRTCIAYYVYELGTFYAWLQIRHICKHALSNQSYAVYRHQQIDTNLDYSHIEVGGACFFRPKPSQNIFEPSEPRAFKFLLQAFSSQKLLYPSLVRA